MATLRFPGTSWAPMTAPTISDFEEMAAAAYARLPEEFRDVTGDVVIRVEDFPEDDVIEEMELETEFDVLGLFTGTGLAQGRAVPETGQPPNIIHLFRRPILDYWAEHEDELGDIITHVLIHEIGHHFGMSDEDMSRIESSVA
jgi:predicted Zn-dependent protease with MMP-like domain